MVASSIFESSSDVSDLRDEEEEDWEDAEPDTEDLQFVSLFDDKTFPDVHSMISYCNDEFGFDFVAVQRSFASPSYFALGFAADEVVLDLDYLSSIKLVNYLREQVKSGISMPNVSKASLFADDKYLQPVLQDDALLFSLDDIPLSAPIADQTLNGEQILATTESDVAQKIVQLESQLQAIQAHFSAYRRQVGETLEKRWQESEGSSSRRIKSADSSTDHAAEQKEDVDFESDYFQSYSYNDIHETMLKDTVRTDAYRNFIYDNKHLFQGKTVLDVGCGTGILSMFCAKAGARRVIAVDNSDIIAKAKINVITNHLEGIITCIQGKIEEVDLPVTQVDIIVSEWMGYCLLFEAMLDSVLYARDRYLAPDGLMVPSHCTLRLAPIEDEEYVAENINFWRDIYGFNMTAMMEKIYDDILVRQLSSSHLASDSTNFFTLPLLTITAADLVFTKAFAVTIARDIDTLSGWCVWFDTFFLPSRDFVFPEDARAEAWASSKNPGIAFTTGPLGKETHWRSGVMMINSLEHKVTPIKSGTVVEGSVTFAKAKLNTRGLEIGIDWRFDNGKVRSGRQEWFMR